MHAYHLQIIILYHYTGWKKSVREKKKKKKRRKTKTNAQQDDEMMLKWPMYVEKQTKKKKEMQICKWMREEDKGKKETQ